MLTVLPGFMFRRSADDRETPLRCVFRDGCGANAPRWRWFRRNLVWQPAF
jgi:hypothetical protein